MERFRWLFIVRIRSHKLLLGILLNAAVLLGMATGTEKLVRFASCGCVGCDGTKVFFGSECPVCWGIDEEVRSRDGPTLADVEALAKCPTALSERPSRSRKGSHVYKEGDWNCPRCEDFQFARNSYCRMCGYMRGPTAHYKPGDWMCGHCGDHQFARNHKCRCCGMPKQGVEHCSYDDRLFLGEPPCAPEPHRVLQETGLEDADVRVCSEFVSQDVADFWFQEVRDTVEWEQKMIKVRGKLVKERRLTAFLADHTGLQYGYSGAVNQTAVWTPVVKEIKDAVECLLVEQGIVEPEFNSVFINGYFEDGHAIGFHADDEPDIEPGSTIASVSLGAERDMVFKKNGCDDPSRFVRVPLIGGALVTMSGHTQTKWKHSVPPGTGARINLTFRHVKSRNPPGDGHVDEPIVAPDVFELIEDVAFVENFSRPTTWEIVEDLPSDEKELIWEKIEDEIEHAHEASCVGHQSGYQQQSACISQDASSQSAVCWVLSGNVIRCAGNCLGVGKQILYLTGCLFLSCVLVSFAGVDFLCRSWVMRCLLGSAFLSTVAEVEAQPIDLAMQHWEGGEHAGGATDYTEHCDWDYDS